MSSLSDHLTLHKEKFWYEAPYTIWLGSQLSLRRNIDKFHFPSKLQQEQRVHILELVTSALQHTTCFANGKAFESTSLFPQDREWIQEHYFIFDTLPSPHIGEAFVLDSMCQRLALINQNEHMQLISIAPPESLLDEWRLLSKVELELEKQLRFAFSELFGFLTADIAWVGTGLHCSCYLHLPALLFLGQTQDLLEREKEEGLLISSLRGNETEFLGDIIVLKNRYTLGVTEEFTIACLQGSANRLVVLEQAAREQIVATRPNQAQDLISRALGVLHHSFEIDTSEALKALSYVKLGLEIGWIGSNTTAAHPEGVTHEVTQLNCLFFDCRRAHVSSLFKSAGGSDQTKYHRAALLRQRTAHLSYLGG